MRSQLLVVLCLVSAHAMAQSPAPAVTDRTPPSASGVGEVQRMEEDVQHLAADVQRLKLRLPDWAAISWYAEENAKLAASTSTKPRVVFLGDSITHNWGQAKYSSYFQGEHKDFVPVNRGIGGQNVAQMLVRMQPDVIALKPAAMVIFAGTNDLPTFKVPDLLGFIEGNFQSIFDLAQAHHIRVIVCSVMPVNDVYRARTETRPPEKILQLNAWLKQQAKDRGMEYVDFYAAVTDGKDRLRKEITQDGLHPTAEGYVLMEPLVNQAIAKALAAR
ncbi:GDSL-type esterase/lipase family protein [Terriglobus tenax]|uniref:GDSL-type esterase/lipase family protein n=1 Tax=Terriglobus tenax TaxID=1111115 RepID=UPI0021E09EF4|nr:GDSL-type esterase/lipase family protein [Terriglobus tenax]